MHSCSASVTDMKSARDPISISTRAGCPSVWTVTTTGCGIVRVRLWVMTALLCCNTVSHFWQFHVIWFNARWAICIRQSWRTFPITSLTRISSSCVGFQRLNEVVIKPVNGEVFACVTVSIQWWLVFYVNKFVDYHTCILTARIACEVLDFNSHFLARGTFLVPILLISHLHTENHSTLQAFVSHSRCILFV